MWKDNSATSHLENTMKWLTGFPARGRCCPLQNCTLEGLGSKMRGLFQMGKCFEVPQTDHTFLSYGAGVQSTVCLIMADRGLLPPTKDGSTPVVTKAVFADTMCEPPFVYEYLEYIKTVVKSIEFVTVKREFSEDLYKTALQEMVVRDKTSPNLGKRYFFQYVPMWISYGGVAERTGIHIPRSCTRLYKIIPIVQEFLKGIPKNETIKQIVGISLDEQQRARAYLNSTHPRVGNWYPLLQLSMTRMDCINWLKEHKIKIPKKSGCFICPYQRNSQWVRLKKHHPEQFRLACEFERLQNEHDSLDTEEYVHKEHAGRRQLWLHPSCKPLEEAVKDFNYSDYQQGNMECEGGCFL